MSSSPPNLRLAIVDQALRDAALHKALLDQVDAGICMVDREGIRALEPFGWLRIGLDNRDDLEHRYGYGMVDGAVKTIAATLDRNLGSADLLSRWSRIEFRVEVNHCARLKLAGIAGPRRHVYDKLKVWREVGRANRLSRKSKKRSPTVVMRTTGQWIPPKPRKAAAASPCCCRAPACCTIWKPRKIRAIARLCLRH